MMPSGLLSNLNIAFSIGRPRAARIKQSQPIHLVESLLSRNISSCIVSGSTGGKGLRYSSNTKTMVAPGSMVGSGVPVVDTLLSGCGNVSGFVNSDSVFFGDRGRWRCGKARVISQCCFVGTLAFGFEGRCTISGYFSRKGLSRRRSFSSLSYSDGTAPEVSNDGSLSGEQISSLAIPVEQRSPSMKLLSGACYMPHPDKVKTGGEDAHFICVHEQVLGVADGVGGWADVGINAGEYARELMSHSVKAIRQASDGNVDPLQVLKKAHENTRAMGSSTACIIALKNQDLHAINLGDSGFIIIRDGCLIFESSVQLHGFNFPFQLARGNEGDLPSSGQVFKIPAATGDIIVAGSDGLFDNLYNKEIVATVGDAVKEGLDPDGTAQKIAEFARLRALDRSYQSPFAKAAQEAGMTYYGGKIDDLTVVVSYVSA